MKFCRHHAFLETVCGPSKLILTWQTRFLSDVRPDASFCSLREICSKVRLIFDALLRCVPLLHFFFFRTPSLRPRGGASFFFPLVWLIRMDDVLLCWLRLLLPPLPSGGYPRNEFPAAVEPSAALCISRPSSSSDSSGNTPCQFLSISFFHRSWNPYSAFSKLRKLFFKKKKNSLGSKEANIKHGVVFC